VTVRAFLRLLFRAGLLTKPRENADGINAEAYGWANLLLAGTVAGTLKNVAAYEQLYGRGKAWPNWLRDRDLLTELLNRELLSMDGGSALNPFSALVGLWPPPGFLLLVAGI
jgi:hypothetical protein